MCSWRGESIFTTLPLEPLSTLWGLCYDVWGSTRLGVGRIYRLTLHNCSSPTPAQPYTHNWWQSRSECGSRSGCYVLEIVSLQTGSARDCAAAPSGLDGKRVWSFRGSWGSSSEIHGERGGFPWSQGGGYVISVRPPRKSDTAYFVYGHVNFLGY